MKSGGIVCMSSDTVYGLFARALDKEAVLRLYNIKGRDEEKPFIILLSELDQLDEFDVKTVSKRAEKFIEKYTPGPVTFIIETDSVDFEYLTRGGGTLAFRIPDEQSLKKIIKQIGPLVAPSANPQGLRTAETIKEAQEYFGDAVDLYSDGGKRTGEPSTIVDLTKEVPVVVRQGRIKIDL